MHKKITLSIIVVLSILLPFNIQAQDQRTRETKIADIVMQLPAKNTSSLNKLMAELMQLGNVVPDLSMNLLSPGEGNDSRLRYAISGLALYASKDKNSTNRKMIAVGIGSVLPQVKSDEIRDYLLIQLQYVAGSESVDAVKPYLTNDRLCDAAARVLIRINNEAANEAMLNALSSAHGNKQLTLAEGLGYTSYQPALNALSSLLGSTDPKLQKTALLALATVASPNSNALLADAAMKANYTEEPTNALESYVVYLGKMLQSGQKELVVKATADILKKTITPNQTVAKSAALNLYAQAAGENATKELVNALNDKDKKYRESALLAATQMQSPKMNAELLKKAKSAQGEAKAELIENFGNQHYQAALPLVLESLKSKDPKVLENAVVAAAKIGGEQAIAPIIKAMSGSGESIINTGMQSLLSINSPKVAEIAAGSIPNVNPTAQIALFDILAQRQASQYSKVVFDYTVSQDKVVRDAAYSALKSVVSLDNLNALASQLTLPAGTNNVPALQEAIYAAVKGAGNAEKQSRLVLDQMDKSGNKSQYYSVLSMIGNPNTLPVLMSGLQQQDAATRSAAFDALTTWNGSQSASALIAIAEKDTYGQFFSKALTSYIAKVINSESTDEQKITQLRRALDIAKTSDQKIQAINGIAKTGTFLGMLATGKYMDDFDQGVKQSAIQSVRTIALAHKDYSGEIVTSLLKKAMALNQDPEADYQRQAIEKHLASLPKGEGFVAMFNGKDLNGWKGLVDNPIARTKMKPAELSQRQIKANDIMRRDWKVENGLLVFEGKGYDNLCSEKKYGDFELYVDWRITPEGDAGIYLRGTPQVQIWDTSLVKVGAQVGSGGLYNNQSNPSKPLKVADNPPNEWNSFFIRMVGEKVTVYLNGQLVTDKVVLENYWNRKQGIFPSDAIELQAHGTRVEYRDLYVRELERPKPYEVSKEEKKEGFIPLFNGVNMEAWTGNTTDYFAQDGKIICDPKQGGHGNLYSEKEYEDFVLRFDFKLTPAANNGLGIRTPLTGDAAYVGMELQILDNESEVYKDLEVYQYHGSIYGVIAAKRGFLKPVGEWNTEEVIANGNNIKVTLNGTVILDGNIAEVSKNFTETKDKKTHPGLSNKSGHIGFLGHGSYVEFKDLRIKELKK